MNLIIYFQILFSHILYTSFTRSCEVKNNLICRLVIKSTSDPDSQSGFTPYFNISRNVLIAKKSQRSVAVTVIVAAAPQLLLLLLL